MNKHLRLIQSFFLVTAPILASSILGISPAKAATLAFSNSEVEFTNFSQTPSNVATFTGAETLAIGNGGSVVAIAEAEAFFLQVPPFATNSNLSLAFGENQNYLGFADSQSQIIGNFNIQAGTNFSFDFTANLNLLTSIDNPPAENARASGDISFLLFDIENNTVLDFLSLTGNLVTEGDNDFIAFQKSDNVNLNQEDANRDFGGKEESLIAFVEGSVERYFVDDTNLALVESERNRAIVQAVPESSISFALLVSGSVIAVVLKRRRK
ncbi:MAG: PEP-CTERM sorting domain-containing protein [Rivularia sp. (in: cyanobacteria)]